MLRIIVWTWLLCQISLTPVDAHSGRKDSQGGHHQRATGTYHFHDGPLVGQTFASKAAGSAALAAGQTGSPEDPSRMVSTMPAGDLAKYLPAIDEGDQIVVHTGFTLSYSGPHEQAEWFGLYGHRRASERRCEAHKQLPRRSICNDWIGSFGRLQRVWIRQRASRSSGFNGLVKRSNVRVVFPVQYESSEAGF